MNRATTIHRVYCPSVSDTISEKNVLIPISEKHNCEHSVREKLALPRIIRLLALLKIRTNRYPPCGER